MKTYYLTYDSEITGTPPEKLDREFIIGAINYWKAISTEKFNIGVFPEQVPALSSVFDWSLAAKVDKPCLGNNPNNLGFFMGIPLVLVEDDEDL